MSGFFENLSLKLWWNWLTFLGVGLFAFVFIYRNEIDIVERKHLLGLSIGMFIVGFSHIIAFKSITIFDNGGYWSTKEIVHNTFTKVLFLIGLVISIVFLSLILWNLV
ncbi:hypothetical protein ACFPIK_17795 [Algoriphagus aquatilis]|uniref:Uncharacterized protein n=1 Tax=Algoriphagus aquatilis TaxID=490186 RepID=A0ABW0C1P6_9BACT